MDREHRPPVCDLTVGGAAGLVLALLLPLGCRILLDCLLLARRLRGRLLPVVETAQQLVLLLAQLSTMWDVK